MYWQVAMKDSTHQQETQDPRRDERREQVEELVQEVREDAQDDAGRYLKETVVPAGGE